MYFLLIYKAIDAYIEGLFSKIPMSNKKQSSIKCAKKYILSDANDNLQYLSKKQCYVGIYII